MLLYEYMINTDDIKKVSLGSVKYLTEQLEHFVQVYEKNILLLSQEEVNALTQLKEIANILKEGRYNELINNPELIIDFNDNNEEYLPSYYPL
jgi:hypothetical protein